MSKTRKPLGILTGTSFSLKKANRKLRRLTAKTVATVPLLPTGLPDFTAKCKANSPFNPTNRQAYKLAAGEAVITSLLSRFKV